MESIDLGPVVGDVLMAIKGCCLFDECTKITGDVTITEFYFIFHPRGKGTQFQEIKFPSSLIEKMKITVVDGKNPPKFLPDGYSLIVELICKNFRTLALGLNFSSQSPQALASSLQQCLLLDRLDRSISHAMYHLAKKANSKPKVHVWDVYDPRAEFERQGIFNPNSNWKAVKANADFSLCETYPALLVVPKKVSDETLKKAAAFRSRNRLTVLSYKHFNHASICRSAQPLPGIIQARSADDEALLQAIRETSPLGDVMHIVDARPLINAAANHANGAGFEGAHYQNCQIKFFGIPNIHVTKDSHKKLRALLQLGPDERERTHWLTGLEATQWLDYLRLILQAAVFCVDKVENCQESVLSHCSDGWDRTAQIVALAELMLDPYYRTTRGFAVLIEKDWVSFGHKFTDRCGHIAAVPESSERSPVFAQFVECVWLITQQFPCAFEFNERLLITLIDAVYSCEFGNFLCNCEKDVREQAIREKTPSLWAHIFAHADLYTNPLYHGYDDSRHDVLMPSLHPSQIQLWPAYYMRHVPSCQTQHLRGASDTTDTKIAQLNQKLRAARGSPASAAPTTSPTAQPDASGFPTVKL